MTDDTQRSSFNFHGPITNLNIIAGEAYRASESYSNEATDSENITAIPPTFDNIRIPTPKFIETETYKEIFQSVRAESRKILLCHGLPGNGKSEIVRTLAKHFPYDDQRSAPSIKLHIQCKDEGHSIKGKLKYLIEQLKIKDPAKCISAIKRLEDDNRCNLLLQILQDCRTSVLVIVEDPPSSEGGQNRSEVEVLRDFCLRIQDLGQSLGKFHIYITSRSKCYVQDNLEGLEYVVVQCHISGFTLGESSDFLEPTSDIEKVAISEIHRMFSGSPMALRSAKTYCGKSSFRSYSKYLETIKEVLLKVNHIPQQYKDKVIKNFGDKAVAVFQALTLPFEADTEIQWEIVCCLSYLHYDRIPKFIIVHCARELCGNASDDSYVSKNTAESLMVALEEYGMCTIDDDKVTTHEIVLNAFRISYIRKNSDTKTSTNKDSFNPMGVITTVVACCISRNVGFKKMSAMQHHLQAFCENVVKGLFKFDDSDVFQKAVVSFVLEMTAVLMLSHSPHVVDKAESFFRKSLEFLPANLSKDLLKPCTSNDQIRQNATSLMEISTSFGKGLPEEFFRKYTSCFDLNLDEKECEFLEQKSSSALKGLWSREKQNKKTLIKELQKDNLYLKDDKRRLIFCAARAASILHNWSRVILHVKGHKLENEHPNYKYMSSLSRLISEKCRKSCKVPLLTETLASRTMLQILLKKMNDTNELEELKKECERALKPQDGDAAYEDGLLKERYDACNSDKIKMIILRNLVRVNARLMKTHAKDEAFCKEGDEKCEELLDLVKKNVDGPFSGIASPCIIYCGKYYAAKGMYAEAIERFKIYFRVTKVRFNIQCWAIYNYARAVLASSGVEEKDNAIQECEKVLKSHLIPPDLKDRLAKQLEELKKMPVS